MKKKYVWLNYGCNQLSTSFFFFPFYFILFLFNLFIFIVLYVSVCHVHSSLPSWRLNFTKLHQSNNVLGLLNNILLYTGIITFHLYADFWISCFTYLLNDHNISGALDDMLLGLSEPFCILLCAFGYQLWRNKLLKNLDWHSLNTPAVYSKPTV